MSTDKSAHRSPHARRSASSARSRLPRSRAGPGACLWPSKRASHLAAFSYLIGVLALHDSNSKPVDFNKAGKRCGNGASALPDRQPGAVSSPRIQAGLKFAKRRHALWNQKLPNWRSSRAGFKTSATTASASARSPLSYPYRTRSRPAPARAARPESCPSSR
jgi:hypothetical protein